MRRRERAAGTARARGRGAAWMTLVTAATGACAFGDGEPFATLTPTLVARYELLPERDAGERWQKLANDFEVLLTAFSIEAPVIELHRRDEDDGGATPDDLPCHDGHCHALGESPGSEGTIETKRSGGANEPAPSGDAPVVILPVGAIDLLAGVDRALGCEPGCALPRAHIERARLSVARLSIAGLVRDGRTPSRLSGQVPFSLEAALPLTHQSDATGDEATRIDGVEGTLDLPADREHPPDVTLTLSFLPTARLFDGISFDATDATGGTIDLGAETNRPLLLLLLTHLAEHHLSAAVER